MSTKKKCHATKAVPARAHARQNLPVGVTVIESREHLQSFFRTLYPSDLDDAVAELILSTATWMERRCATGTYRDLILRVKCSDDPLDPRLKAWAFYTIQHMPNNHALLHVGTLYTLPLHRRRGLASLLLHLAKDMAKAEQIKDVVLQCRPHLRGFYERAGFSENAAQTALAGGDFLYMHTSVE